MNAMTSRHPEAQADELVGVPVLTAAGLAAIADANAEAEAEAEL